MSARVIGTPRLHVDLPRLREVAPGADESTVTKLRLVPEGGRGREVSSTLVLNTNAVDVADLNDDVIARA